MTGERHRARARRRSLLVMTAALALSVGVHLALALVPQVMPRRLPRPPRVVTLDVTAVALQPTPPEPEMAPRVEPRPVPPRPKVRPHPRLARPRPKAQHRPRPQPVTQPKPPTAPPKPAACRPQPEAPPAFGTQATDPKGSLSQGNTLNTDPGNHGVAQQPTPSSAQAPAPVTMRIKPKLLQEVKVAYPTRAKAMGIEGSVMLKVKIEASGQVSQVRVVSGPGFGLNAAAQRALRRFRFQAAQGTDGRPMAHWITYRYTFRIDD